MSQESLQELFAPANQCFGCGPANARGLRIRSLPTGRDPRDPVVCTWQPSDHHEAFDGVVNGGIVGTLLDCHSNWTAIWHLMCRDGLTEAPCAVTADFHVILRRPTPSGGPIRMSARAVTSDGPWVTVEAEVAAGDQVTARCTGRFVAVGPGHPAYRRW